MQAETNCVGKSVTIQLFHDGCRNLKFYNMEDLVLFFGNALVYIGKPYKVFLCIGM